MNKNRNKIFLLDFSAEKLSIIDLYCRENGVFRAVLFRQILDQRLKDNADKIKAATKQINKQVTNFFNS